MSVIPETHGRILAILALLFIWAPIASAEISLSPDVSVDLGGGFVVASDEAVLDSGGVFYLENRLPPLPANVGLSGLFDENGDVLFSIDSAAVVEGVFVEPRDVARYDGTTISLELDGSAAGIPDGAKIDAIVVGAINGFLLLSLDVSARLGSLDVDDEDLFRLTPSPLMIFDGSAEGIDPGLDLNAAAVVPSLPNEGLVSFDGGGIAGGVSFEDEDVLTWNLSSGAFGMLHDGSDAFPGFEVADVTAVPEPGFGHGCAAAVALVAALARKREAARG